MEPQYLELATQIFGASSLLGNVAMLRDLHFESTTYVIQVFKEQATSDGTDTQGSNVVCAVCQFQGNCNLRLAASTSAMPCMNQEPLFG